MAHSLRIYAVSRPSAVNRLEAAFVFFHFFTFYFLLLHFLPTDSLTTHMSCRLGTLLSVMVSCKNRETFFSGSSRKRKFGVGLKYENTAFLIFFNIMIISFVLLCYSLIFIDSFICIHIIIIKQNAELDRKTLCKPWLELGLRFAKFSLVN
jgi:hypothetical protein